VDRAFDTFSRFMLPGYSAVESISRETETGSVRLIARKEPGIRQSAQYDCEEIARYEHNKGTMP